MPATATAGAESTLSSAYAAKDMLPDIECKSRTIELCQKYPPQSSGPSPSFDLAYIEFDDMGEFWTIGNLDYLMKENTQVSDALTLIKERKLDGKPVVVITFIHGWKNNASAFDGSPHNRLIGTKSLLGFRNTLQTMAKEDPARAYIGVFIAWRGQSITGNVFSTYWNRRDAAERVGRSSMTEALFDLMFATRPPNPPSAENRCGMTAPQEESEFIVVGHSFGGRILQRALTQPVLALIIERSKEAERCRDEWNLKHEATDRLETLVFQPPASLIVFINPANDSFETKGAIEAMKRMNLRVYDPSKQGNFFDAPPLFVSILSDGDWATTKVMPIAQFLSAPFVSIGRKYDRNAKEEHELSKRSQGYYYIHNDGRVQELITHKVTDMAHETNEMSDKNCDPTKVLKRSPNSPKITFPIGNTTYEALPMPQCRDRFRNNTPFWVITVPSAIVKDHSDIFEPGIVMLTTKILESQRLFKARHNSTAVALERRSEDRI
jgi:pimeloyl-ACP methyl ester carboxylesterase